MARSLTRVNGPFVIASNSTERYRDQPASPKTAAGELGVAHVVHGSVRCSGKQVRIDVELIDALSGQIIWSDRIERASGDVFALQDSQVA